MGFFLCFFFLDSTLYLLFFTVLHPQYKLQYFKESDWQQEWIDTAEEMLRTQFETHYRKAYDGPSEIESVTAPTLSDPVRGHLLHKNTDSRFQSCSSHRFVPLLHPRPQTCLTPYSEERPQAPPI